MESARLRLTVFVTRFPRIGIPVGRGWDRAGRLERPTTVLGTIYTAWVG